MEKTVKIYELAENMIRLSSVHGVQIIEMGEWDIIGTTREIPSSYRFVLLLRGRSNKGDKEKKVCRFSRPDDLPGY